MHQTSEKLYKIKSIASLSGFSPTLLRAWERRYNFLEPIRTETGHRLYTQHDLNLLLRVKGLLRQGHTIGELVALGKERLMTLDAGPGTVVVQLPAPGVGAANSLERLTHEVVQASLRLDENTIVQRLDQAWSTFSTEVVIQELLIPCARQIGDLWARGKASVAAEHLMVALFSRRLHRILELELRPTQGLHPALVTCLPDELHEFGCLVLCYFLNRRGLTGVNLGASLPLEDLELAIRQLEPRCVLLSVGREALLQVHQAGLVQVARRWRGKTNFLVGGRATAGRSFHELEAEGLHIWPGDGSLDALSQHLHELQWRA